MNMPKIIALPNRETNVLVRWLIAHGGAELDALIAEAFDRAAERDQAELQMFGDYKCVAWELEPLLCRWFDRRHGWIYNCDPCDHRAKHGLLGPLLSLAAERLDFGEAGLALLKLLGKWSPPDDPSPFAVGDDDGEEPAA